MGNEAAGGQPNQPVVPGAGAENPPAQGPDPTKVTPPAGPPAGSTPPPGDAPGQNAQQASTITIDGKVFSASDVVGILNAKKGLEDSNADYKKKLEDLEAKDLSDKEKAEKEAQRLSDENAKLRKDQINILIDTEFTKAGVQIKAADWNHGIDDPAKVTEAVQNLIKERPGIVKASGQPEPGTTMPPPGTTAPPPGTAPAGTDSEKELAERYARAKTPAEIAELDKEFHGLRGSQPQEGRKTI